MISSYNQSCSVENLSALDQKRDRLTNLICALAKKLDSHLAPCVSPSEENVFRGLHDMSPSDNKDGEECEVVAHDPDPFTVISLRQ